MGQTEESKSYFVVEFRLPIEVLDASDPKEAAEKARDKLEKETGIRLSLWYTRVYEYGTGVIGIKDEYFCNPGGTTFRSISKNEEDSATIKRENHE